MRNLRAVIGGVLAACLASTVLAPVAVAKPSEHPFELLPGSFSFAPSSMQAGAHADWLTKLDFAHEEDGATYNDVRDIVVDVPGGFDASDTAVPTCTQDQLLVADTSNTIDGGVPECPIASQVGQLSFEATIAEPGKPQVETVPIYNMEVTTPGVTAELGYLTSIFTGFLRIQVRPQDLGLTSATLDIPPNSEVHNIKVTIWGVPAAAEHDALRGATCEAFFGQQVACHNEFGSPQPARIPVKPFLSNPTSCGLFEATAAVDSWEEPFGQNVEPFSEDLAQWSKAGSQVGPITGCERVPFEPSIEAQPSTRSAEAPSGLTVSLVVPQAWENPLTLSTSYLKDATVTLPEGMTANPGLANGLGACTPAQYAEEKASTLPGEGGCPPESKIGSIEIQTPLLNEAIDGAVYIATPYDNPFSEPGHPNGSLLALYVVAKDRERGVLVKVAGKITPNPVTGQLVTSFDENPQQPFSRFILKFRPGATAPLISPPKCGSYSVQAQLSPWSAPSEPRIVASQPFSLSEGAGGTACPADGVPPFKPAVVSGTQNNAGGSYSPFYLRLERQDGEQELIKFSTTMPPGLSGNLTGIPFCSEAEIQHARQQTGAEALEHPICPGSEIGHTIVEAGVGSVLAQNPGKLYLAGPYHGAPLSLISVTSAKVGPFDLGTVVIRFALDINPLTAQVEISGAQSDPIPHILDGIVVHVRNIHAYVDRPHFMINPTNCEEQHITDAVTGSGASYANPAGEQTVNVNTRFQAANCASLAFKPTFTASTSGKTSRKEGASLHVSVTYPSAPQGTQADIKEVHVELPIALPSELKTLQKACTHAQFEANPAGCPEESVVGHAKVITPILPEPLEGPAYFVSNGIAKFPELVLVLHGYHLMIVLHGETFISKKGITSSTFKTVPDEPFSSFELTLPESSHSALAANGDLCKKKLVMPTLMIAQNGAQLEQNTPIAVEGCSNKLEIDSHKLKGRKLVLRVSVPAAGKLKVSGKGVRRATKRTSGRETVRLNVKLKSPHGRHSARKTRITLHFKASGANGEKQKRNLTVKLRAPRKAGHRHKR